MRSKPRPTDNYDCRGNFEGALPLGAIPGIEFTVLNFNLSATDMLVLMTDGIAEAQNTEGHIFGFDRIATRWRWKRNRG